MVIRRTFLFAIHAVTGLGCASAGPYTYAPDGPLPCERAACAVDLGAYRSVQERAGQDSDLVVAVAISGGGHRAGNFGTGTLLALEGIPYGSGDLLDEVDYFSTVSGGGFAVAAYLAARLEHERETPDVTFRYAAALDANCTERGRAADRCRKSSLARSYEGLFSWLRHPGIIFTAVNAGDLLQREMDTRLLSTWSVDGGAATRRSITLRDVFVPRDSARRPVLPYWVTNAALYRNGAIFPFTPDILARYQVSRYRHRTIRDTLRDPFDMPISVGVKASVSVPGLIPLTTLESHPTRRFRYLRLLDGGLADNLGVVTATDLLCQDSVREEPSTPGARRRLMLVVDAYPEDGMPYDARAGSSAFGNVIRAALIGIDSWRGRYGAVLRTFGARCGFRIVALDFEALESSGRSEWAATPAERASCVAEVAPWIVRSGESVERALARLKRDAQAIRTRLRIAPVDQERLTAAGMLVVCFARPAILAAVAPPG